MREHDIAFDFMLTMLNSQSSLRLFYGHPRGNQYILNMFISWVHHFNAMIELVWKIDQAFLPCNSQVGRP